MRHRVLQLTAVWRDPSYTLMRHAYCLSCNPSFPWLCRHRCYIHIRDMCIVCTASKQYDYKTPIDVLIHVDTSHVMTHCRSSDIKKISIHYMCWHLNWPRLLSGHTYELYLCKEWSIIPFTNKSLSDFASEWQKSSIKLPFWQRALNTYVSSHVC